MPSPRRAPAAAVASLLACLTCGALPPPAIGQSAESGTTILVLDASGSMWGRIEGRPKIDLAREAIDTLLARWPGGDLGLMAYGHRRKGDCEDIELLLEPTSLDTAAIRRQANVLNPKGMTPISAAVRQAAEHLRFTEQKATVILISDGEETCHADPCALGEELERLGIDFTAHVIGFDIESGSRAQQQLECLSGNTGGRYLAAKDAGELNRAMQTIAQAPPQPATPEETAGIRAKEGKAWMPGYALEAETGITLDHDAPGAPGNHDFSADGTAADCRAMCDADDNCAGWHYEPAGSYFLDYPRCHLQGGKFAVRLRQQGEGWAAGIKPGVKLILDELSPDEQPVE